jgi:hypothetical protein
VLTASQLTSLQDILPADRIHLDAETCERYGQDWTRYTTPQAAAIVFPVSIDEVQAVVRWANAQGWVLSPLAAVPACLVVLSPRRVRWWCRWSA